MTRLRALVVDDDPGIIVVLRRFLEARGCEVLAAAPAEDPFAPAAGDGLRLAFVDMHVPGVDVVAAVARLSRSSPLATIVLMTGAPEDELIARCRALGARGPVLKPFLRAEIDAWIDLAARG